MAAPNIKSGSSVTTVTGKTVGYAVTTSMAAALTNSSSSGKVLKINSVYCANVDGSAAADISLEHYNGTTGFAIGKTIAVPADATQVLVTREAYIYLEEGHSLRAQASAASDLELVISYEDISLEHYNGTTGFAIGKTIAVPADATQVLVTREAYIYLEEGHSLRAQASATGDLELVISYEDIS